MAGPTIAVVEANPALREMLCEFFEAEGYVVYPYADSGAIAAASRRPSVVVMDGWLRTRDEAQQLYEQLTRNPNTAHIPVIVLAEDIGPTTSEPSPYERVAAELGKPFDLDDLLAVVDRSLGAASPAISVQGRSRDSAAGRC
jgi:CheY-like chemotaxis protein